MLYLFSGIKPINQKRKLVQVGLIKVNPRQEGQNRTLTNANEAPINSEPKENLTEDDENMKKREKEFDSNVVVLNYLASVLLFLIILSCDLAFWISMRV